jgi:hypothetical protein
MEYLDKLAETAVKEAIEQLAAAGKRPSSRNVPAEAGRLLAQKGRGRGRITSPEAEKRVRQAIERLREKKQIKAPEAPYNDWALTGQKPRPKAVP